MGEKRSVSESSEASRKRLGQTREQVRRADCCAGRTSRERVGRHVGVAGRKACLRRVNVIALLLLHLPGFEPLEHYHGAAAERAEPSDRFTLLTWR